MTPRPIIAAALVLLAACGASPSSPSSTTAAGGAAVSYAHCMRSHGLPGYPDPGSSGTLPKTSARLLGVSTAVYTAAQSACQDLLPAAGTSLTSSSLQQCYLAGICPQDLVRQALSAGRVFAQCMRAHGVLYWPDPTVDAQGRPLFNINVPRPQPQRITAAGDECSRLHPAGALLAYG